MKKLSFIVMACLMVLGLAQCKKNEPTSNDNADNGNRVSITLTLDNGGQRVHPEEENGLANVVYDNGDVVYVGSNGKYMGCLTYNGSVFTGSINAEATEGQPLQFIFMGGQDFHANLTENSTTEYLFNIGNQSNGLAVVSCAPSNENFSLTNLSYTAYLRNKCALVKFDLGEVSTDTAIILTGMKTEATIGFDGTVNNGTATGDIVTYGTGTTRYAVVLSDQAAVTEGTISADGYEGTFSIPTAAYTNAFLTNATMTLTAVPTIVTGDTQAIPDQPTSITLQATYIVPDGLTVDEVGFYYGAAAKGLNELPANLDNKVTLDYVPASGESFSYTLTGLTEGTAYQYCVYVKTGDQETYGELENFTTPASDPVNLAPDFEDGNMPDGWTPNGTNNWYVDTEDYYGYAPAFAGSYSLYVDGNGHYDSDYFVSPALVFDGSAASLSFAYATPDWEGDHNDLSVCYGTSPNGPWNYTSFVWQNSSSWTTATVDLSSLNGTYYIAFESYDGYGYCTAIDNINITGATISRGNITATTNGNGAGIGAGLTAKPDLSAPARTRTNRNNQQRIKIKK